MARLLIAFAILAVVALSTSAWSDTAIIPLPELVGNYTGTDQGKIRVLSLDPGLQPVMTVRLDISGFASSGVGTCPWDTVWVAEPKLVTFVWTAPDGYSWASSVLEDGPFELEIDITRIHAFSGTEEETWDFLFVEGAELIARLGGLVVVRECSFPIYPEIVVTDAELRITHERVLVKSSAWSHVKALYH